MITVCTVITSYQYQFKSLDHRVSCDHQLPAPIRELWSPREPWSPATRLPKNQCKGSSYGFLLKPTYVLFNNFRRGGMCGCCFLWQTPFYCSPFSECVHTWRVKDVLLLLLFLRVIHPVTECYCKQKKCVQMFLVCNHNQVLFWRGLTDRLANVSVYTFSPYVIVA